MKKLIGFLLLGLILIVLFPYQEVSAEPPSCDFSHLGLCNDQSSCEGAGGYWCDNSCQVHSCPPVCDSEHLLLCLTQEGCEGAGGYWCDNSCQMYSCPPVCDSDSMNPRLGCPKTFPWLMLLLSDEDCYDNYDCPESSYCSKSIGNCDGKGLCVPVPQVCITVYDPVCGCDGNTYGNTCDAASMSTNVQYEGACITCFYEGVLYTVGDVFPDIDGCNTCTCLPTGAVACTKIACPL